MNYKHLPCYLMKFALSQHDLVEPMQMWAANYQQPKQRDELTALDTGHEPSSPRALCSTNDISRSWDCRTDRLPHLQFAATFGINFFAQEVTAKRPELLHELV